MSELFTSENVASAVGSSDSTGTATVGAPVESPITSTQPASATSTQPVIPDTDLPEDFKEPVLPVPRHRAILNRHRTRAETAEAAAKAYADALGVQTPDEARAIGHWRQQFARSPADFAAQLIDELAADPQHSIAMRTLAARVLNAARKSGALPPMQTPADAEPSPDLYYDDPKTGQRTLLYSAEQQQKREAWRQRQTDQKLAKVLAPMRDNLKAQQQRQQAEAAWAKGGEILSEWRQQPGFTDHEAAISAYIVKEQVQRGLPIDMGRAYAAVVGPMLTAKGREDALKDLRAKASVTTLNPTHTSAGATALPTTKKGSFMDPGVDDVIKAALAQQGIGA